MINNKIYIKCNYNDKEIVKKLGAAWDPDEKKWYFIGIENDYIFKKWKIFKNKEYEHGNITEEYDFNKLPDKHGDFYEQNENEKNKYYIKIRNNIYIQWGNGDIIKYINDKYYFNKYHNELPRPFHESIVN